MAKLLFSLILALIFWTVGFTMFPFFHTMLSGVSTTGMPYVLAAGVTAMPYILLFVIIYGIVLIISNRTQK